MKRIAFWIYQIYAWLFLMPVGLLLTLVTGWLTMLASIIWSPKIANRYVAANWGRLLLWLTPVWMEIEGAENADPDQSYVVVCNHQSQYDIFVIYGWLKLDLKWVLKAELRKVPGVGIGCEKAGHIFVERGNPEQTRQAVSNATKGVGGGVGVLFFAEGTRSINGKLGKFKKGAFRVATAQNLPVLPVTIIGTHDIQKPKSMMVFPGKVKLVIHPAIASPANSPEGVLGLMKQTRDTIASALPKESR